MDDDIHHHSASVSALLTDTQTAFVGVTYSDEFIHIR